MNKTKRLTYAGLFLAISILLPLIFHLTGIPGQVFLPMHIPVLLCGFICGKKYGLIIGAVAPLINTLLIGMPVLYPIGISMVFELAGYGFFAGLLYEKTGRILPSLLLSRVIGRILRIAATFIISVPFGGKFIFAGLLGALFVPSIWGILIQLGLIPLLMKAFNQSSRRVKH